MGWVSVFSLDVCGLGFFSVGLKVKKEKVKVSIEERLEFECFLLRFGLLVRLGWGEREGEFLFFFFLWFRFV